ncbi:MAG: acyl-CoA carboxylase subunit beta [Ruminococcaceae bacterium]|nr:acyl-CoA carboxylase subunit beta [Oscillospiraceae bacterium]
MDRQKYNVEKQHEKMKYHAIERILLLLDRDSFTEIGAGIDGYGYDPSSDKKSTPYDGVITGRGTIGGKTVFIFAQDFTVAGGSIGLNHGRKIAKTIELAIKARCPVIGLYDSGGARIGEGINALAGCGEMMHQNTLASGVIPQISIVVGPCAGAAAYSPALTDFVFMVEKIGQLYITGNKVIENVTGEKCTLQELGGAKVHSETSGVAHFAFTSEKKCYAEVRKLIGILPSSYLDNAQYRELDYRPNGCSIDSLIPEDDKTPYSMHQLIYGIVDEDSFVEIHRNFASSMITGFAKLSSVTVGIIANNPMSNSGCIDRDSSDKAARFVRFCDAYSIPIVTLVDTPGYLPGLDQEHSGIIRHGAKLLFAYSESTTTKITVIIRKAYGGAYIAMGSKHLGADYVYACPKAALAVMGAEGAVSIIYHKELAKAEDEAALKKELAEEYSRKYMNTTIAQIEGYVDEVISPDAIRKRVFEDIKAFENKDRTTVAKRHGNIPL